MEDISLSDTLVTTVSKERAPIKKKKKEDLGNITPVRNWLEQQANMCLYCRSGFGDTVAEIKNQSING